MKKQIWKSGINGLVISTVKVGSDYETMVIDSFGNSLEELHAHYKSDAKANHHCSVVHYASPKNSIHAI